MDAIIKPRKLNGTLTAPPSKSHSHRLLIGAYLAGEPSCVDVPALSEDIAATKECLETLFSAGDTDSAGDIPTLDCRESGSTLRFLLPIVAALPDSMIPGQANSSKWKRFLHGGRRIRFLRGGRLPKRPLSPLQQELEKHGVSFKEGADGELTISGRMSGGEYTISGGVSSQFITGMLFALPLTEEGGTLRVTGTLASRPYVDMTLKVLRDFGIKVTEEPFTPETGIGTDGGFFTALKEKTGTCFVVPGGQQFIAPVIPLHPEGDWSNSAFFLVADALGCQVDIHGLMANSPQGDKIITDIITGCERYQEAQSAVPAGGLTSSLGWMPNELLIDAEDIPDLVPALAVLAWGTGTRMQIIGAGRLRIKESDRLETVKALMDALDCPCEITEDGLMLAPHAPRNMDTAADKPAAAASADGTSNGEEPIVIDGMRDHRIVMAAAIAATACDRQVRITGCEAVNKSWPLFFDAYASLGGKVHFS